MNRKKLIQINVNTYFIVVAIFLFGANTALAARPYLPSNKATVPLAEAVSQIQSRQKENNAVEWVRSDSAKFSHSGVTALGNNESAQVDLALPEIFNGLQDMDNLSSNGLLLFNNDIDSHNNGDWQNFSTNSKASSSTAQAKLYTQHGSQGQSFALLDHQTANGQATNNMHRHISSKPSAGECLLMDQMQNVWTNLDSCVIAN